MPMPVPKYDSLRKARERLAQVTRTPFTEWRCCTDPVTGIGEEFFFMHLTDEFRFVYVCIEDGIITATETN